MGKVKEPLQDSINVPVFYYEDESGNKIIDKESMEKDFKLRLEFLCMKTKLVKEELNNTLDSMEMDKVPDDYGADSDDAVNVGWVEGIKYALNVIERKIAVIESKKERK